MRKATKIIWGVILALILLLAAAGYFKFYFVFSDGYQTGELNKFAKTGYVFKTYEGIMILSGYGNKSNQKQNPSVQSNYFEFSVENKEVAEVLLHSTGKRIEVHYKKYLGALPWRGFQRQIVDSVTIVDEAPEHTPEDTMFL